MTVRDRIRELRRVPARDLRPHPRNWRRHPDRQANALRGALAEIGYADALLVRELEDRSLEIIDGHLRAQTTPDQHVPVLVLDVDENEANKLLAIFDPLAEAAQPDPKKLTELLREIDLQSGPLKKLLEETAARAGAEIHPGLSGWGKEPPLPQLYQVVIECGSEEEQEKLYQRLSAEGLRCKVLTL